MKACIRKNRNIPERPVEPTMPEREPDTMDMKTLESDMWRAFFEATEELKISLPVPAVESEGPEGDPPRPSIGSMPWGIVGWWRGIMVEGDGVKRY